MHAGDTYLKEEGIAVIIILKVPQNNLNITFPQGNRKNYRSCFVSLVGELTFQWINQCVRLFIKHSKILVSSPYSG